jgi:hypothetical protein
MFPERRLLHEKVNKFNRIAVKELCVIIVMKVVWISHTIVTHYTAYPSVEAHHVGHFVQPSESRVRQSDIADGCHHRVPEKLVDSSSAQVVLDTLVR